MSKSYNLRSSDKKKRELQCYLERLSNNNSPQDFNPEVRLERLKILEAREQENFRFYFEEGRIVRKQSRRYRKKKILLLITLTVILFSLFLLYWQNELQICRFIFYRKAKKLESNIKQYYFENIDPYKYSIRKYVVSFMKKRGKQEKLKKHSENASFVDAVNKLEIKNLVKTYLKASKCGNKAPELPFLFPDDQCRADGEQTLTADSRNKNYKTYNSTYFDCGNLTDYALASQGAKIISIFDTKPYGIFTLQHLDYDFGPLLSNVLQENVNSYSKKGPASVLIPWQKPGDCWAFKGSQGRIQIQLSQKVMVTAVTIDHIPRNLCPYKNVSSAPKKFSVFGVVSYNDQTMRRFLGRYEYRIEGPPMQTFSVDFKTKVPVSDVEFVIESNQGNQMYTCIYKIRVHGYK